MRADADALLSKLRQGTLNYHQFADPLADLELWPIFEALLADPRVIEIKRSRVEEREFEFQRARAHEPDRNVSAVSASQQDKVPHLFSAYAAPETAPEPVKPAQVAAPEGTKVDLRDFLHRLKGAS